MPAPPTAKRIEMWPLDRLRPYERNARTHSPEQIAQIAASIQEFGFTNPLLVDGADGILAGHGRLAAAKDMGLAEVPVIVLDHLSATQRKAYILADNQLALNAGWDMDALRLELGDLQLEDFDLNLIGFSDEELADLLPDIEELPPEDADADAVPEPPAEPVTKPGDVWLLGKHRVMCGDSTDVLAVDKLTAGSKVDFVYMDPPYGMNLDTSYAQTDRVQGNSYAPVIGDDKDFDPSFFFEYFKDAREHFWWGADYYCQTLPKGGSWVVWDKKKEDLDESIGTGYELCWSMVPHKRMIARFLWSGFTAKERNESRVHPTQKPVALHEWFFERWGKAGDVVADLFGGSGSTLIACEKTSRHARLMELDPRYCDVIVKRWQQFTGKAATLEATGEPFPAEP